MMTNMHLFDIPKEIEPLIGIDWPDLPCLWRGIDCDGWEEGCEGDCPDYLYNLYNQPLIRLNEGEEGRWSNQ